MTLIKILCSGEAILVPPRLPTYLSSTYNLKSIVGKPADEDVKAIHAVIRSQNTMAHLPTFYNPDLSMQLSQHLFNAQMAIYRANYSMSLLPGDKSVYIPPTLPPHIPGTLERVVGVPSDEEIKSAQSILRSVDGLATYPHLFDENFTRYMHYSSEGEFLSETQPEETFPAELRLKKEQQDIITHNISDLQGEEQNVPQAPSELAQLVETMKAIQDATNETKDVLKNLHQVPLELAQPAETIVRAIKDATSETKGVLENMNRVLTLIKNDQTSVGCVGKYYQVYKNPVNQQGIAASEYGLPQLRFEFHDDGWRYGVWMHNEDLARYLKFFGIGSDLYKDGDEPKLIDGQRDEAKKLLLAQVGVASTTGA